MSESCSWETMEIRVPSKHISKSMMSKDFNFHPHPLALVAWVWFSTLEFQKQQRMEIRSFIRKETVKTSWASNYYRLKTNRIPLETNSLWAKHKTLTLWLLEAVKTWEIQPMRLWVSKINKTMAKMFSIPSHADLLVLFQKLKVEQSD